MGQDPAVGAFETVEEQLGGDAAAAVAAGREHERNQYESGVSHGQVRGYVLIAGP
jgi:hypothetical protein